MNRKIKILFTIPNFDTAGSGLALSNIATNLDKNFFDVEIACLHNKGKLYQEIQNIGIKIHIIDLYKKPRPISTMFLACYNLSKIFKKINPNIIHSYNYSSDYTEPLAAKIAKIKWIYTKKNMSWEGPSYRSWKLRSWLSDAIICQNIDMMNIFFPNSKKVKLIPIGVDTSKYINNSNDTEKNKIRQKWNILPNSRVIITLANLIPVKGVETLIKAFTLLANENPDWILMIVGRDTTKYAKELKKQLYEKSIIKDRIIFTGSQDQVKPLLDISEIYVQPSISPGEGSPIAILEAMSNGKVIIGSDVPGIRDQLNDFPSHLFKMGDVLDLKEKLVRFISNDVNQNILIGKQFSDYVIRNYDLLIEKQLLKQQYINLIDEN